MEDKEIIFTATVAVIISLITYRAIIGIGSIHILMRIPLAFVVCLFTFIAVIILEQIVSYALYRISMIIRDKKETSHGNKDARL